MKAQSFFQFPVFVLFISSLFVSLFVLYFFFLGELEPSRALRFGEARWRLR